MSEFRKENHKHEFDNGLNDDGSARINAARHCLHCSTISLDYEDVCAPCLRMGLTRPGKHQIDAHFVCAFHKKVEQVHSQQTGKVK